MDEALGNTMPKVSVLMPVYNSAKYLHKSIESILNQSYEDFEFLIFDDGSTDESLQIISSFRDLRIKIFSSTRNLGHVFHLNRGILLSKGQYIARMDSDDISHHERFKKQVDFLDNHSDVDILGTWYQEFGARKRFIRQPLDDSDIRLKHLFLGCALAHPSVMMRRNIFTQNDLLYEAQKYPTEDYWLWIRSGLVTRFSNIPQALLYYRVHSKQISQRRHAEQIGKASAAQIFFVSQILNRQPSDAEIAVHQAISSKPVLNPEKIKEDVFVNYLRELQIQNEKTKIINPSDLSAWINSYTPKMSSISLRHYYLDRERFDLWLLLEFIKDSEFPIKYLTKIESLKFIAKCLTCYRSTYNLIAVEFSLNSRSLI
jgi:glycosyltransferase involved in cell wall biosynthesis